MNTLTVARYSALALASVIPLSTSLTSISGIALIICCLLTFSYRKFMNPAAISILLLVMWYGFSALHSLGDMREIEQTLHKMARLLLIPLIAGIFVDAKWRRHLLMGFVVAVIISAIAALNSTTVVFKDNIITSLFVAYTIFVLAHFSVEYRRWIWLTVPFAALLAYYLLFVSMGRSGQIIFLMLAGLFCWQRLRKNIWFYAVGIFAVIAIIISIVMLPSSFITRQKLALTEMQNYSVQHEDEVPHTSSMGVRFILVHNTWELIKQKPLLGWGTGSYRKAYADNAPEAQFKHDPRTNPHNQYLAAWAETGVIGLIALIGMFATLLYTFWRQQNLEGQLGFGLVLAYIAGCVINSWLFDCAPAYFFVLFIGVFLSSSSQKNST